MTQNIVLSSIKYVLVDLIGDILYWPIWWYSSGFKKTAESLWQRFLRMEERLALRIWFINLLTPMFGQTDWQGRLISFFIRLIQIIVRFILLLIVGAVCLIFLGIWLILPVFVTYQAWINFLWLFK